MFHIRLETFKATMTQNFNHNRDKSIVLRDIYIKKKTYTYMKNKTIIKEFFQF